MSRAVLNDDTLVMAEWFDSYIPPRHCMAVVTYGNARKAVANGCPLSYSQLQLENFGLDPATTKRSR